MTRRSRWTGLASVALLAPLTALAPGCSDDDGDHASSPAPPTATQPSTGPDDAPARTRPRLTPARCPAAAPPGCQSASGRIIYVESVDPDGDGDAHFVLASRQSITGPGLAVIDVRRDLRPNPLPGPGDRISAAGPVYRGSYGQRQIEAIVLNVAR